MGDDNNALDERRWETITGTDVGKIVGVSRYGSRYMAMMNKLQRISEPANDFMQMGQVCEGMALKSFETFQLDGRGLIYSTVRNRYVEKDGWLGGTPDVILSVVNLNLNLHESEPDTKQPPKFLEMLQRWSTETKLVLPIEIKSHFGSCIADAEPWHPDEVPLEYWLQIQHYMYLTGSAFGILYCWTFDHGWRLYLYGIDLFFYYTLALSSMREFYAMMRHYQLNPYLVDPDEIKSKLIYKSGEKVKLKEQCLKAMKQSLIFFESGP